jgi:hypothetical protein
MMTTSTLHKGWLTFIGLILFSLQLLAQPTLVCRNPEGNPAHTAIFDFQSGTTAVGKIVFGDGEERNLTTQGGSVSHVFQHAGVYFAVFMLNNLPVDTATVIVRTPCGWAAYINELNATPIATPPYCENISNGVFHIEPSRIAQTYFWTTLHNVQRFGVNGDAASFEVRAKNPVSGGGISCNDLSLTIVGDKGKAHVSMMTTGCDFYTSVSAGISARAQLSQLARDLDEWHNLKITTENRILKVFYEGTMIYFMPYLGEIGEVLSLSVNFKGSGSVDFAELKDNGATTPRLRDDFADCQNTQRSWVTQNDTLTICSGQSLLFNNRRLTQSGLYRDTISALNCVDTVRILNLTVLPVIRFIQNITIRQGDSLVMNGIVRRISGTFTDTLRTAAGCDSLVETNLTVLPCNLSVQILRSGNFLRTWVQNAPPQYQTIWTLPNGTTTTANVVEVTVSGVYSVKIKDVLGCEATAQISAQIEGYALGQAVLDCGMESVWLSLILKKNEDDLAGLITNLRYDSTKFKPTGRTRLTRVTANCLINHVVNGNEAGFLLYLNQIAPIVGRVGDTLFLIEVKPTSNSFAQNAVVTLNWSVEEDHFTALSESFVGSTTVRVEGTTAVGFSVWHNNTTEFRRDNNKPIVVLGNNCTNFTDTFSLDGTRRGVKISPKGVYQIKQMVGDILDRRIESSEDVYLASQIALGSRSFVPTCYQMWAADAECNGKISAIDISILQQRLLGYMDRGFLMPDGSYRTRLYFPRKMLAQRNWHVSNRYPDADTEGGMTRQNVPSLINNCFNLDGLTRCDTLPEAIVEIKIGDLDNSASTVLRSSGTLIADVCQGKRRGDSLLIPVVTPQYATSFDVFTEEKTPFSGIQSAESGTMNVKANDNSNGLNLSGYSTVSGGIAAKQPLFYLTLPYKEGGELPRFQTDKALINGQPAIFKVSDEGCKGAQKAAVQSLQVHPNPTTDIVEVNFTIGVKGQLSLIDVMGRNLQTWETDGSGQVVLDLSAFAAGVYALRLSDGSLQKIVKH